MDAYLECLQNYIEEHLLEGPSPYLTEYHCMRSEAGRARAALEASLTEEQGALFVSYILSLRDALTYQSYISAVILPITKENIIA